ncbi:DUF1569 domain-containing protein [Tautonia marina]|uniref:DUF1569 domain-containing protein n=1 Tax=Tautonia marina TaxID=2653855 RepID=UPI0013762EDF|nr:DUF1569 domain-containing protein [Tautonia marina]
MQHRSLDFRDADAVIAEIRHLQHGGYTKLGKWNLAQMCDHLRQTLRMGLDGSDRRLPWVVRTLVTGPIFRRVIKTRRMKSGIPVPKELVPTSPDGPDDPAAIDACIATLQEARDASGPLPKHPVADLTVDQWKQLNWIHCAHHLGFLIPHAQPVAEAPSGIETASGPP